MMIGGRHWPELGWLSILLALTTVVTGAAFALGRGAHVPAADIYLLYVSRIWLLAPVLLALGGAIASVILLARGEQRPLHAFRTYCNERLNTHADAAASFGPLLLLPLLMGGFGTLKQMIPLYNPFSWDDIWAKLGQTLCFGWTPWQLTHAVFGSPLATVFLDRLYLAWVPLLFLVVPCVAFAAPRLLRAQFFLSFAGAFVLIGVVGAFLFSSAGPCFATLIGTRSAGNYVELMSRLHAIDAAGYNLSAVHFQNELWHAYQQREFGFGLGISAMPSMHNAIAFLYALAASRLGWKMAALGWTFAGLILIGSVHLGWHYLSDGLVAWAAMYGIWQAVAWYLRVSGFEQAVQVRPVPVLATLDGQRVPIRLVA
ncbi:phosphatase PAP2 family protein [Sphingomonas sp. BN140010]|uniref:Phosphatase PAP2 family protein n=1 Tax=Sphingomonas arvum TaxID=2992113 RepID=A0ABT3JCS5_9SPHN|nr:phosphatase PAP2 family protein [Sphingomonas sp. BN140010]MCW3796714.1 phosphatase PAP2 family protein [Sphingomonas sp. BN140010]